MCNLLDSAQNSATLREGNRSWNAFEIDCPRAQRRLKKVCECRGLTRHLSILSDSTVWNSQLNQSCADESIFGGLEINDLSISVYWLMAGRCLTAV